MISSLTYKLLVASKIKGVGKKTLQDFADDKLFFETPLEKLSTNFSELENFLPGSTVYDRAKRAADTDVETAERLGHSILGLRDSTYPALLKKIGDRPAIIFVKGDPRKFSSKAIAIIGTREPTVHGQITANRITSYFANEGWQIVSGLAIGLDTTAHEAAVYANASTVAVLAHGLETIYPKQNQKLAEKIVETNGLLVSEYPYGTPSFPSHFVERDRIQAALACGVVMVQSDESGGSWHASRAALRYGRYLIVPTPTKADEAAGYPKIRGNQKLIHSTRQGQAAFLKCESNDLDRLLIIRGREDYPTVAAKLASISSRD